MPRTWGRAAAFVAVAYAAAMGLVGMLERAVMYPAPRDRVEPVVSGGVVVRIRGAAGRTVHALHVPARGDAPTIVHFHGNGEALVDQASLASSFHAQGMGFFAVEYPGYGLSSDGSPSEHALYEDAESALVHLRDSMHVPADLIVLEGQSLGTGVAVEMALRGYGSRLVLVSPYTSMVDMARRIVPVFPMSLLVRDRYDNALKAPRIRIPTLVVHGSDDEVIPVAMGRRLASLFPNARLRVVNGAHHNDIWHVGRSLVEEIAATAFRGRGVQPMNIPPLGDTY